MEARAEIVVVGAGVVGAAIAHHLVDLGARDVLVVDRTEGPAQGSTGRATGGFRAQFDREADVALSLLAREELRAFEARVGANPGFVPAGYLWLAVTEGELETLRAGLGVQRAAGLAEAREVSAAEARALNSAIADPRVLGGAFCPTDGLIRPRAILEGYLASATRRGARVAWGTSVTGAERRDDGTMARLVTSRGAVEVGTLVNAAGAWAGELGRALELDVPVTPLRRSVAITEDAAGLPDDMSMTLWVGDGFHLRVRDGRVLLLRPSPEDPTGEEATRRDAVDPAWLDETWAVACARVPSIARTTLDRPRAWSGLYEMSPDGRAIVGRHPLAENVVLANGSSGHGVMHAPALGRMVAELVVRGAITCVDPLPFRPTRFAEGDAAGAERRL